MNKIYNVIIGGNSIGLTRNYKEAQKWLKESHSNMDKRILSFDDNVSYKA